MLHLDLKNFVDSLKKVLSIYSKSKATRAQHEEVNSVAKLDQLLKNEKLFVLSTHTKSKAAKWAEEKSDGKDCIVINCNEMSDQKFCQQVDKIDEKNPKPMVLMVDYFLPKELTFLMALTRVDFLTTAVSNHLLKSGDTISKNVKELRENCKLSTLLFDLNFMIFNSNEVKDREKHEGVLEKMGFAQRETLSKKSSSTFVTLDKKDPSLFYRLMCLSEERVVFYLSFPIKEIVGVSVKELNERNCISLGERAQELTNAL